MTTPASPSLPPGGPLLPSPSTPPGVVPAISVRHLWHRYGSLEVLRDVSFEVAPGEIFGFIGPNGAGKTTTIRVMATLLEPTAGRVEIDGIDASLEPDAVRRIIGYMPDHAGVYERITVREFLEFFADAYRIPELGVVDAVIELTELTKLEGRLVATLSKGMKQRLQIARTLLHDPKVLVLDEPASDLDPRARIEVRDLLLELRELGKTIFLSSHILTELSDVCTSVGILERGQLVVAGPIGEIAERLASRRQGGPTAESAALGASEGMTVQVPDPAGGVAAPGAPFSAAVAEPAAPAGFAAPFPAAPVVTAGGVAIPEATRKRLKLRVLGDSQAIVPMLAGGSGVLGVESGPGGLLVLHYVGGDQYVAEVVRYLVTSGVGVVGVEPERNELERIFLEVTRGELT
ncbi:MAG TPA: ABC transporter ATP-binding protein [Polyangiaceae bacterium]|nr:ABC transporter ATP-binding protein [Polyangiaceae bacterium]